MFASVAFIATFLRPTFSSWANSKNNSGLLFANNLKSLLISLEDKLFTALPISTLSIASASSISISLANTAASVCRSSNSKSS